MYVYLGAFVCAYILISRSRKWNKGYTARVCISACVYIHRNERKKKTRSKRDESLEKRNKQNKDERKKERNIYIYIYI